MLFKDPPDHTRLRTLVHKAFTPRMIERLRERAQAITDGLIDKALANGGMDLMTDFALPLPVTVIAEMLGVPPADYAGVPRMVARLAGTLEMTEARGSLRCAAQQATVEFSAYLRELIAERRKAPQEDLISALVAAEAEGDKLSEDEMVAMCILLLVAGHETTVNLIGNGTLALLRHPDQWEKLKADPALVKSATEELLRFDSPVQMTVALGAWRTSNSPARPSAKASRSRPCSARPTTIRPASPIPANSTSRATRTRTSLSATAFTSASVRRWHAWKGRSPLRRWRAACPICSLSTENPPYRETYVLRGLAQLPVTF